MRTQFIFGPALLIVGCWCLYVWQANDEKLILGSFHYGVMEDEYRDLNKWELQDMAKSSKYLAHTAQERLKLHDAQIEAMRESPFTIRDGWANRQFDANAERYNRLVGEHNEKAQYFERRYAELGAKWKTVRDDRRRAYLWGGAGCASVGAVLLLAGARSYRRGAREKEERKRRREEANRAPGT